MSIFSFSYLFYKLTSNFLFLYIFCLFFYIFIVTSFSKKLNFITQKTPTLIHFILILFPITKNHNFAPFVFSIVQNSNLNPKKTLTLINSSKFTFHSHFISFTTICACRIILTHYNSSISYTSSLMTKNSQKITKISFLQKNLNYSFLLPN